MKVREGEREITKVTSNSCRLKSLRIFQIGCETQYLKYNWS